MEELNEEIIEENNIEDNIEETIPAEPVILPDVYKKQTNPDGPYQDENGNRYDILTCKITESKERVQVGTTVEEDEEGNEIEVPVYETQVVINKGWDSFNSLEEAAEAYGLITVEEAERLAKEEQERLAREEAERLAAETQYEIDEEAI